MYVHVCPPLKLSFMDSDRGLTCSIEIHIAARLLDDHRTICSELPVIILRSNYSDHRTIRSEPPVIILRSNYSVTCTCLISHQILLTHCKLFEMTTSERVK